MRVLGVDWGEKRIGIATGETEPPVATPRQNIEPSGNLFRDALAVAELARVENAEAVVVGVPENSEGADRLPRLCRTLAERIRALGVLVFTVDETMTSAEAETAMAEAGIKASRRDKRRDGEAAARILERHFQEIARAKAAVEEPRA